MPKPDLNSLPPSVRQLWLDVETLAGHAIEWRDDPDLPARMGCCFDNKTPVIECRDYTVGSVAEELKHLHLSLEGFPDIRVICSVDGIDLAARLLNNNVLHHHIIFPELLKMGFDRWDYGADGLKCYINKLPGESANFNRIQSEPCLRAAYAMVYARVQVETHAGEKLRGECDNIFDAHHQLLLCKDLGQCVADIVAKMNRGNARQVIHQCLDELEIAGYVDITSR